MHTSFSFLHVYAESSRVDANGAFLYWCGAAAAVVVFVVANFLDFL